MLRPYRPRFLIIRCLGNSPLQILILGCLVIFFWGIVFAADIEERTEMETALQKADSLFKIAEYDQARNEYYRALNLLEISGDTLAAALCELRLAQIAFSEGYFSKALKYLEDIQPALEAAASTVHLYDLNMTKGKIFSKRWQFAEAAAAFDAAAIVAVKMGEGHKAFLALESAGRLSLNGRRDEAAILRFASALLQASDRSDSGYAYNGFARAFTLRKDYPQAIAYFDSATMMTSDPPDTALLAEIYGARGAMNSKRSDYAGALKYYTLQLELVKAQGDEIRRARILTNIAAILEKQGKIAWAMETMEEALKILEDRHCPEAAEAKEFMRRLKAK